jgi:hypothetical protein
VGKRSRKRSSAPPRATADYADADGNVLTLREAEPKLPDPHRTAASSLEDDWQRRGEILFERYAVRWQIAGLVYEKQKELLARYRMADSATREWVQRTIDGHVGGRP